MEERESDWALEKRKYPWMDETSRVGTGGSWRAWGYFNKEPEKGMDVGNSCEGRTRKQHRNDQNKVAVYRCKAEAKAKAKIS